MLHTERGCRSGSSASSHVLMKINNPRRLFLPLPSKPQSALHSSLRALRSHQNHGITSSMDLFTFALPGGEWRGLAAPLARPAACPSGLGFPVTHSFRSCLHQQLNVLQGKRNVTFCNILQVSHFPEFADSVIQYLG